MYSQFGEDDIIATYFPADYKGVCVEVGAADGIMGSNSLLFEKKGWRAICAEPNAVLAAECKKNRKEVYPWALSDFTGLEIFTVYDVAGSKESAISSLEVDERLVKQHTNLIHGKRKETVNVTTLDKLLKICEVDKVDFISIDTEGTELRVLKGFDIERWRPKLFVIENNFEDPEIEDYLAVFGYSKVRRNAVNDFYLWTPSET